ncbi:MAG: hydrogenase iron-sulfur subunit [Deltaproteobacteria bacterium]|nr:hydrogenase iron-sulfur subunit [Deltaproteobacteria bacterium]
MSVVRLEVLACRRAAGEVAGARVLPCAGRVSPRMLLEALARGADGVAVVPCGDERHGCRFERGAERATMVVARTRRLLATVGVAPERVACIVPDVLADFSATVERLGPTRLVPWTGPVEPGLDGTLTLLAALLADPAARPAWSRRAPLGPGESCETLFLHGVAPLAGVLLEEALPGADAGDPLALLAAGGVEARELPDERGAGGPLRAAGETERFADLARRNAERFAATGAKRIVTACTGCARTLTEAYAAVGVRLEASVVPLVQVLAEAGVRVRDRAGLRLPACDAEGAAAWEALLPSVKPATRRSPFGASGWLGGSSSRAAIDDVLARAAKSGVERVYADCLRCALSLSLAARTGSWSRTTPHVVPPAAIEPGRVEVVR